MHILIFGDSITQGFHDEVASGWANRLFAHCVDESLKSQHEKYAAVFNLGVSGNRSSDLIKRFEVEFSARQNEKMVTIFAIGTNDLARNVDTQENWCPLPEFKENMTKMITMAKEKGQVILVGIPGFDETKLTPIPWFDKYSHLDEDRVTYDSVLKELADSHDCHYIETVDLFNGNMDEMLTDGLHPSAAGHQLIYERVKEKLEEAEIL